MRADAETLQAALQQRDAIFALEGFAPDNDTRAIDAALLTGRVSLAQIAEEMCAWAAEHHTTEGFCASRPWLKSSGTQKNG